MVYIFCILIFTEIDLPVRALFFSSVPMFILRSCLDSDRNDLSCIAKTYDFFSEERFWCDI